MQEINEDRNYVKLENSLPVEFGDEELKVTIGWSGGELSKLRITTNYGDCEYRCNDRGELTCIKKKIHKTFSEKYFDGEIVKGTLKDFSDNEL